MFKVKSISLLACLIASPFFASAQSNIDSQEAFLSSLNDHIPLWQEEFAVPGVAVAIFENGEIIHKETYGYADVKNKVKVTDKTGFNIGSISKTVAAWGVMKLVEEGKISLDDPAENYLTRWHLPESKYDINGVTIRRLLSHTAGLSLSGYPGWSPSDTLPSIEESLSGKNNGPSGVELIMEPGTQWKYSGGGYTLLQLIVEEVTGEKFEDYMEREVVDPLGMSSSSYTIDHEILKASSHEHDRFGDIYPFELFTAKAAAGFHTTLEDFVKFGYANLKASEADGILEPSTMDLMKQPVPASNGIYGLGYFVDSVEVNGSKVALVGHGGANDGWRALFQFNDKTKDGLIVMTNSGNGGNLWELIRSNWLGWKYDQEMDYRKSMLSVLLKHVKKEKASQLISRYKALKSKSDEYTTNENTLNSIGYVLLEMNRTKEAIDIFKLNAEEYPNDWNLFDSLGEAYMLNGNSRKAIKFYSKSIKLNPHNTHGANMLAKLRN
ncbi:serine hydrolase [Aureibacter tunicatorum]|uniref:CubicO group peptidase (Beta-lactamase class C family) n=1 Tax=Aureibacter tunicatorum TaxID=866807 RepID=A0AAE4BSK3_9BACT|nr:serine hydrolase [Aureibacter tunicatorum]MDR6238512.1 CubicO group peptidase (beta-lactamase class C family) [Aureibacter tunicatorum]BDD05555.1 hypothetical protein AUTU_30380 [Aureibacter tunicatorum]